jgi:CheY-like chemotaxis protein
LRALREVPETRASLLIALTGYGQRNDRDRARDAGFDHHLTKPAEPDELLAIIETWRAARAAATIDEPVPRPGNLRDATSRR